jgi:putative peptidoglycan lipid II flippase
VAGTPFRNLGVLSIILTLVTLVTKMLGFVREVLVSAWFGASHETDAFYLVFSLLFVAVSAAAFQLPRLFVPEYQRLEAEDQDKKSGSAAYLGANLLIFLPLALLATVVLATWTDPLIRLAAPRLPTPAHDLAVELTLLMLPVIPCISLIAILSALAHARGHLLLVQFATPLINVGGVVGLLLLRDSEGLGEGIRSLAIGLTAGSLVQCLIVCIYPFRERLRPHLSSEALRKVLQGSGILVLLWLVNYSGGFLLTVTERYFSTGLPEGHLSCMGYALRLASLPNQVLFGGLLIALLPALSNRVVHNDPEEMQRLTLRAIRMLLLLALPILAGMALLATPVVQLTFERGLFDSTSTSLTALLLICYVPSLLTEVLRLVIATLFFANARPGPPIVYGILRVTSLTIAYAFTWESYGAVGMVISLSVVDTLGALLFIAMAHKMLGLRFKTLLPFTLRLLAASAVAVGAAGMIYHLGDPLLGQAGNPGRFLLLSAAALGGAGGFLLSARPVGLSEVDELLKLVGGIIRRRLGRVA